MKSTPEERADKKYARRFSRMRKLIEKLDDRISSGRLSLEEVNRFIIGCKKDVQGHLDCIRRAN